MAYLPVHASGLGLSSLALFVVVLGIAYYAAYLAYNLFLHPLRAFPGPILFAASNLPKAYYLATGRLALKVADLHRRYGPVLRLGPDELAFSDPQAWKDIYGHRAPGEPEFPKDERFYRPIKTLPENIVSAQSREYHGQLRRQIAHGFSERSMRAQEPIIGAYADLLVHRLRENCTDDADRPVAVNMREWLNWCTFDVIGDLGFGSPFGCLESSSYHPWVRMITDSIKFGAVVNALVMIGGSPIVRAMSRYGAMRSRDAHQKLTRAKLLQRMELGAERPDFIEGLIRKKDALNLDVTKLQMNASLLIIAGSETTATLLSGATFLLLTHPEALEKLTHEVRSTFADDADITLSSVGTLSYMLACLNESLRRYPPVGIGMPRLAPAGGAQVAGHFVPEGTRVAVWQYAISHDPRLWTDPMEFHPERFLQDNKNEGGEKPGRFAGDVLDAMQPFSVGPRNCIGKNLAYAEMRLILAKIVFNFDMRLADESRGWLANQKIYTLWDKPSLQVYLTPVKR